MLVVYNCLAHQHDLRLVALAVAICGFASFTAIRLLKHVQATSGPLRYLWLAVAATATGAGIWATHFIAMLAFAPGIPSGYDVGPTILSLLIAIVLTGLGFGIATSPGVPDARALGGTVVGGAIATMHYTGMSAFKVAGRIQWDTSLVMWSIVFGAVLGALALVIGLRKRSLLNTLVGALLLTLGIGSMHFTAMGAASIVPDPTIVVPKTAIASEWLAIAVAAASLTILAMSFQALWLDLRERRRSEVEAARMRGLANAAVEGLLVWDGSRIVTVNESFAKLSGSEDVRGIEDIGSLFPEVGAAITEGRSPSQPIESGTAASRWNGNSGRADLPADRLCRKGGNRDCCSRPARPQTGGKADRLPRAS